MLKKINLLLLMLFLVTNGVCFGQDLSITSEVDRNEIDIDEQIVLTITVTGNVSNIPEPSIPQLNGFTAYSSGRSQSISIINTQVTSSITFTYLLVPNDVGGYTLGPFTINFKGQTYSSGPINVKVNPRSTTKPQAPSLPQSQYTQPPQAPSRTDTGKEQKELFIETYVDKLTAYVNEQVTLTFAFYQAVDLFENPVYTPPATTGFWTEDMPPQKKYYQTINGRRYLVTEIKTALFATSPGTFTVGPARLEASVEDLERFFSRRMDLFDDPFSIFKRGKPVILTTEPITVEILPLPEKDKPASFKGDVGRFDITASVDKNTVEENQPVTLKINIKGKGNIKTASSPDVPEGNNLKFYDSGSSENISKTDYIVQGEKLFEKLIIPKLTGDFKVGPIEYSYFDSEKKEYITKQLDPITIKAVKSKEEPEGSSVTSVPQFSKDEVRLLKKDISYIKTTIRQFRGRNEFLYRNKLFFIWVILPLLLLIGLYLHEVYQMRLRTDIGYARSRRARRVASKRLRQAGHILLKGDIKGYYAELYKAVIEFIADKLNIPHPSITKDILEQKLKDKSISSKTIDEIKDLFDMCDMARFASGSFTKDDMDKTLIIAREVIEDIERAI